MRACPMDFSLFLYVRLRKKMKSAAHTDYLFYPIGGAKVGLFCDMTKYSNANIYR